VIWKILADGVFLLHLGFILFVVLGGIPVRWRRRMALVHLPCVAYGAAVEHWGWICPLTPLENRLRELGGGTAYSGDFVERYLIPVLYPSDLRRDVQIVLGVFALAVNIAVYLYAWRCAATRSRGSGTPAQRSRALRP